MPFRTDMHNNPTAFTTAIAKTAGLIEGTDYTQGSAFNAGQYDVVLYTAQLIGDPVAITLRVINTIGFFTHSGHQRWTYIAVPMFVWESLSEDAQRDVIGEMYRHEGGTAMVHLFPNYRKLEY